MGGYNVTVTGTNFTGVTSVSIGGNVATFTNATATSIEVYVPSHAAGTASVLITTPNGTNAANTLFTYIAPPVPSAPIITSSTPGDGSMTPGTVTFSAPTSDGGSYISDYEYNVNGGSWTSTYSSSPGTISVYSMTVGVGNTVLLRAISSNGAGATASVTLTPVAPAVPFTFSSQSSGGNYSGTGGNSYDSLTGQLYSYGSPETMVFTAGITGTLNYSISGYDMMGGSGVYMSLKVGSTTISTTSSSSSENGTTAITAGQTVSLTFNGSSMAYSSFSLYMS
jgi:hypothetical protein